MAHLGYIMSVWWNVVLVLLLDSYNAILLSIVEMSFQRDLSVHLYQEVYSLSDIYRMNLEETIL